MTGPETRTLIESLPERGEPRLATCEVCGHRHACYAAERPGATGVAGATWSVYRICLGCLMRVADPAARVACADCDSPSH